MASNQSIKLLFLGLLMLSSFGAQAADDSSPIQQPEIPSGVRVIDLPRSTQVGKKQGTNCYASYLIQKVGTRRSWDGKEVFYQIAVTNIGDCHLTGLWITDFFPDRTVFKAAFPRPEFVSRSKAVWTVDFLPVGRTVYIDLKLDVRSEWSQWITNTACVWNAMIGQQACAWVSTWIDK